LIQALQQDDCLAVLRTFILQHSSFRSPALASHSHPPYSHTSPAPCSLLSAPLAHPSPPWRWGEAVLRGRGVPTEPHPYGATNRRCAPRGLFDLASHQPYQALGLASTLINQSSRTPSSVCRSV
jgi:hypothetical protein